MPGLFDSILGDEDQEKVVRKSSKNKLVEGIISEVWSSWCKFTERTGARNVPTNVRTACKEKVKDNYSKEALIEIACGAAKTQPHKRDASDTRRLVSALKSTKREKALIALARAQDKPFVPFSDSETVVDIEAVEKATRLVFSDWTHADLDAAAVISEKVNDDDLESVVEQAVIATGLDPIHPADVLRVIDSKKKVKAKARGKNTYSGGLQELDTLDGAVLEADPEAEKMLMRQKSAREVMEFHTQAPSGFWERVIKIMHDHKVGHQEAYDEAEKKFGWHPRERAK